MAPLAASVGSDIVLPCDVTDEASMDAVFAALAERWGGSTSSSMPSASRTRTSCAGAYVEMTTAANFTQTMLISVYSFTAAVQRAATLMTDGRVAA